MAAMRGEQNGVELEFIKPGKPMQNGFIERFNRTYREAVFDMYIVESLNQVRSPTDAGRKKGAKRREDWVSQKGFWKNG
jgi:putative transposase